MQLQIHICVVPFQGQLHLWLQSHLCITIDHVWGVNSGSGSSSRSIFGLYLLTLICVFCICVVPFVVPLHLQLYLCLTLDHVGVHSQSRSSCRSIFVLSCEGQLHLWLQSHLCLTFRSCVCRGINTVSGSSSRSIFLQVIIWNTNNPMLSSKLNVLSHNSIPSGYIWKIHSQVGVAFSRQSFWGPTTLCYFQTCMFCPRTLFHIVRFEKFLHKQGSIFEVIILSTKNTILSSKLNILSHNPAPDAYLCCTFAGSIPSLASVPSMSHLRSCGGVNSICSSIFGLQLFDLNLGSTPYPQPYVFFKIESFVP